MATSELVGLWEERKPMREPAHTSRDGRRKHRHWKVTIYYADGQKFTRVYTERKRAEKFALRQKRSPVVRSTRVREVT